jgi:tRNA pseudouridine55 synthase
MKTRVAINGILLVDKPIGMSSNGALQRAKRLFNAKKVGHTGSLDPLATGMLPLCFGEATKFSQYLLDSDKVYVTTAQLGIQTTTGDKEGEVLASYPVLEHHLQMLDQVLPQFRGSIEQIPPMFSALKHEGKPLYQLARKGIEVERKPRQVTIHRLELLSQTKDQIMLRVRCSKGTYIRTLVEDIGRALGCGAHVSELRRLTVLPYHNSVMYTFDALEKIAAELGHTALTQCLLPMETSIQHLPALQLSPSAAFYLRMGQNVRTNATFDNTLLRLLAEDGRFLGLGEVLGDGVVKPHRLLAQ